MAVMRAPRVPSAILLGLVLGLIVCAGFVDPASLSGQRFWSDGATYYSMARSLVADGDLRYEAKDVARVRREYPSGPQGVFLKRTSGALTWDANAGFPWLRTVRADEKRVYFAKAFAYPVAAAPFVLLLGSRGLIVCNAVFFGCALWLVFADLRRTLAEWLALAATLALFVTTVAPVYVEWMTPEVFNFAVVTASFVALRRQKPTLSALLLAVAIYSKPYNLLLAIPLGLLPFFERERGRVVRRLFEALRRGMLLGGATAALFMLNAVATGEFNYQGGERKAFHGVAFPFEGRVTFGNSGEWMTTNQLGPKIAGQAAGLGGRLLTLVGMSAGSDRSTEGSAAVEPGPRWLRAEPEVAPEEVGSAFLLNCAYFWIGRYGGAALYFCPIVFAVLAFVVVGPRGRLGWLGLLSLAASFLLYVRMMPDNWYGGSGTIGNRYFTNLLPLVLLILPRGRELLVGMLSVVLGGVFVAPLLVSPLYYSLHVGQHTLLPQYSAAPLDLTMLNDLGIFGELWRKKQPFGDVGEEGPRGRPPAPTAYYLYFPDDSTYFREVAHGGAGFWLRGGTEGEVILRALGPARSANVRLLGGPEGDRVTVRVGPRSTRLALRSGEERALPFDLDAGVLYHGDRLHVLRFRSSDGAVVNDPAPRRLGTFVRIELYAASEVNSDVAVMRGVPTPRTPGPGTR
jgi:hypothetical protein